MRFSIIATTQTNYLKQLVYAHGNSHVTESNWLNFYNDSHNTSNITVDGKVSYVYNSSGYLARAKDELSGYEIRYTYSGGKVTSAREFGGNALGQIVGLSYHSGYTEIRNSGSDDIYNTADDLITRYTFDKNGRTVSMYTTDSTKTQIFGATAGEYESEDKIKNNIKTKTAIGGSATNYLLNGGFETIDADGNAAHWVKSSSRISYLSSYAGMAITSIWDKDVRADMNSIGWNPFNDNESDVQNSSKVSFYKGVPVFRTASGGRSGSFGAIFLTKGSGVDDLRHERGHNWQLMMMGIGTYSYTVGLPSPLRLGKWDRAGNYYGAPWETMADILGGVQGRTHSKLEIANAWGYYAISTITFPFTALYWH